MGNAITAESMAKDATLGGGAGSCAGKTILVTGGSSGLGLASVKVFADTCGFAKIVLACRDVEKGRRAVEGCANKDKIHIMKLDLESFEDVKRFCGEVDFDIDVLMLNAGLYNGEGLSKNGYEKCFQVCHLAHFLLYRLLEDKLVSGGRVIVVASAAYRAAKSFEFGKWDTEFKKNQATGIREYGRAKLANIYFAKSVSERLKDKKISVHALHPGGVDTPIYPDYVPKFVLKALLTPVDKGAITQVYLSVSPQVPGQEFAFWVPGWGLKPKREAISLKKDVQDKLWEETEKVVSQYLQA